MNHAATLTPDATDQTPVPAGLTAADRCDAGVRGTGCGAQAYARVTVASGGILLFCGHHYKANAAALAAAGANVEDFTDTIPTAGPGASA